MELGKNLKLKKPIDNFVRLFEFFPTRNICVI